jgi:hypothetical protein
VLDCLGSRACARAPGSSAPRQPQDDVALAREDRAAPVRPHLTVTAGKTSLLRATSAFWGIKMDIISRQAGLLIAAAGGFVLAYAAPAMAQLTDVDIFKNLANEQTGAAIVSPVGAFFDVGGDFLPAGEFDTATMTYPGPGSPLSIPITSPTSLGYGSPLFPTQAAMDAAFPFGAYDITASNSVTMASDSSTIDYTVDAYTSDIPALTAASFGALNGLSTALSSLTLNFNSFTPSLGASFGNTYFTIFGTTQFCGGLAPSATSCTIDPQALLPGTTYTWELDFSDRTTGVDPNGVNQLLGFDVRTDGTFTTAVPESSTWAMMLLGFAGLGFVGYRKTRSAVSIAS